jgi:hypothetical protein
METGQKSRAKDLLINAYNLTLASFTEHTLYEHPPLALHSKHPHPSIYAVQALIRRLLSHLLTPSLLTPSLFRVPVPILCPRAYFVSPCLYV